MMNAFVMYDGVYIMNDLYWNKIKERALLSKESFDIEIRNFIQIIKNSGNLRNPVIVELPILGRSVRHKLHTFERKYKVHCYPIGDDNKATFRKLRILFHADYIDDLKLDTVVSITSTELPELTELPQLPELITNPRSKIVEYLTSIKELLDKIIRILELN